MITGFALIPLTFAVGFGIDYARAMSLRPPNIRYRKHCWLKLEFQWSS